VEATLGDSLETNYLVMLTSTPKFRGMLDVQTICRFRALVALPAVLVLVVGLVLEEK
jgi:hypothetical protein